MEYKKYRISNINVYTIKTNKFKNAYIEFRFRDDIKNVDAPVRTFMLQLLNTTTNKYQTTREYNIALEDIYEADVYTNAQRTGYVYNCSIGIDFINPKYIKEKDYFKKVFKMLIDCILYPHVKDNKWDEVVFNNHIDNHKVYIDKYKEDPVDYTIIESKRRLFNGSVAGQRIVGSSKDVERITPSSLYQEWYKMLNDSTIDIVVVGELNMEDVIELIKTSKLENKVSSSPERLILTETINPYKKEVEEKDFNQTSLIMYLQTKGITDKEKYIIGPLYRNIIGSGGLSDKLGTYLRMKNSLCYAYTCQIVVPDSYMFIATSLSYENVKKAKECILNALEDMKKGRITKEEMDMHKKKLISDIKMRQDDIFSLGNNYFNHDNYNIPFYKEYIKLIEGITIEEIINYANKWELTYEYILKERG